MRKTYFPDIDGLRTLAIVPVIWWHFISFPQPQCDLPKLLNLFAMLIPSAHTGVRLFFVISGFLISYLLFEEKEKRQRISISNFYKRRILRIWPLYFSVLFFGFVLLPTFNILFADDPPFNSQHIPYEHFWQYLFFLANYDLIFNHQTSPILSVLWSVAVEEQFYLFWPLAIQKNS